MFPFVRVALAAAVAVGSAATALADPRILAAGDIVCRPGSEVTSRTCRQRATARLVLNRNPNKVLTLGDNQYENGTLWEFRNAYANTWGQFKRRTRPTPGNHEYNRGSGGAGYFDYFGARAGESGEGYYSFDVGPWHIVALNSMVPMGAGSPQLEWLNRDLFANPATCTLAYWHHPLFSSGEHGGSSFTSNVWQVLYRNDADVVLNGHDHNYERFAPQTPTGVVDRRRGIREFVVGTGGKGLRPFADIHPNSRERNARAFGVLRLRLRPTSYDWRFVPIRGQTFSDRGTTSCH